MDYRKFGYAAVTVIALSAGKAEAQGIGMSGGIGLTDRGIGMGIELGYVPRHKSNVHPQFQQIPQFFQQPIYPRHNSNQFHQQPRPQYHYPGLFIQPQFVPQTPQLFQQPIPYRTWPHPDQIMQAQGEELTLPVKTLEYGFYRTLVERPDRCDVVGGLENMFKIDPATPGYFIPNDKQVTSWEVARAGTYELYAGGNDWRLRLGIVQLNVGDRIKFVKIAPIIQGYSQPVEAQTPSIQPNLGSNKLIPIPQNPYSRHNQTPHAPSTPLPQFESNQPTPPQTPSLAPPEEVITPPPFKPQTPSLAPTPTPAPPQPQQ